MQRNKYAGDTYLSLIRRKFIAAFFALAILLPLGTAPAAERLKVVTTTGMIAAAASQIGGNLVELQSLMGPGVDPHAYRQTRSDIVAMANADLVLWNGLFLEAQLESFLLKLAVRNRVVAVAEGVPAHLLIGSEDYANRFDPHLWMNPTLWSLVVVNVRDALIDAYPLGEEGFRTNADAYLAQLRKLASYSTSILSTVPTRNRVLVSSHDAFSYFGRAHGFEVVGIQGISTESETGLRRIAELVDLLVERKIRAVFVETSTSDRSIRALIEGAAASGHTVVVGGELYSDAMGEPGTYEGTYIGMIEHNVNIIARAMGGQPPATGMQGFLN